jgi:hypothetical protein
MFMGLTQGMQDGILARAEVRSGLCAACEPFDPPNGVLYWRCSTKLLVTEVGEESGEVPGEFTLSLNYPNPFNPTTVVSYQLPVVSEVRLVVYDLLGREVAVLVNEKKAPGSYQVTFDASVLTSGVYFYRLKAADFVQTRKLLLVK